MFGMKKKPGKYAGYSRDDFEIKVSENIATSGFDTTKPMKYKYIITLKETGEPVKVDYQFTVKAAWADAQRKLTKMIRKGD